MATEQEVGIVIKSMDFDDNDKIITILTEHELISFIALGVRKIKSKNRIALQLGNIIEVELFKARLQGKLSKLKKAVLIKQPPLNYSDTAFVILEMMKWFKWLKNPSRRIFEAYVEAFDSFGKEYNHHLKVYVLARFLDSMGIWPVWDKCIECNRKDRINGFEFYKGGFTCALHTKKIRSVKELKAFNFLGISFDEYKETDPKINLNIYKELQQIFKNQL